jgi:hypothetical protein
MHLPWVWSALKSDNLQQPGVKALWHAGCWKRPVEDYGLLQRVKVCPAIRAGFQVLSDFATLGRINLLVKIVTDMVVDVGAVLHVCFPRADMYGVSSFRRNALALRSRDLVASTEILNIPAVSSFDLPSTSLKTKTTLYSSERR